MVVDSSSCGGPCRTYSVDLALSWDGMFLSLKVSLSFHYLRTLKGGDIFPLEDRLVGGNLLMPSDSRKGHQEIVADPLPSNCLCGLFLVMHVGHNSPAGSKRQSFNPSLVFEWHKNGCVF